MINLDGHSAVPTFTTPSVNGQDINTDNGVVFTTDGARLDRINTTDSLRIPKYDDPSNGSDDEGNIIYVTGDGAAQKGIYTYDESAGSYQQVGLDENELRESMFALRLFNGL
jgi:hypothetical protein